jgi:hypothetical protein
VVLAESEFLCYDESMTDDSKMETVGTIDETKGTPNPCLANVGQDDNHYQSCGERLRKRNNGSTYCPEHGPMV